MEHVVKHLQHSKLDRHKNVHSFEGYLCEVCDRRFRRIDKFNYHCIKCVQNGQVEEMVFDKILINGIDDNKEEEMTVVEAANVTGDSYSVFMEAEEALLNNTSSEVLYGEVVEDEILQVSNVVDFRTGDEDYQRDVHDSASGSNVCANGSSCARKSEDGAGVEMNDYDFRIKSNNLTSVLERISGLQTRDQERVIRQGFRASPLEVSEVLLMMNVEKDHEAKLLVGLLDYLKRLPVKSSEGKAQFSAIVYGVCGTNIEDNAFFEYLCKKLGKRKENMWSILNDSQLRGRKPLSTEKGR